MSRLLIPHPAAMCGNRSGFGLIAGKRDGIL